MEPLTITTKILTFVQTSLCEKIPTFIDSIAAGHLAEFEGELSKVLDDLYQVVAGSVVPSAASAAQPELRRVAQGLGLGKLTQRPLRIQLRTGRYLTVPSLYAKKIPRAYSGPRHVLSRHWKLLRGASPAYYSVVGLLSVLCPSFDVACQVLEIQGIEHNRDRVRSVAVALSRRCQHRQAELSRADGETLRDKRVILGIDGGRTRMRRYKGRTNAAGHACYETPWMEPKMFVIDVLDEHGRPERLGKPIYGCRFGDDQIVELLMQHLAGLEVQAARQVQIVADGAPWIWNRVKDALLKLGVGAEKIIETVDHYHASEYVHKLVAALPSQHRQAAPDILKNFKHWLWEGDIKTLVKQCGQYFKRPGDEIRRYIGYLDKNSDRMQYAEYRK